MANVSKLDIKEKADLLSKQIITLPWVNGVGINRLKGIIIVYTSKKKLSPCERNSIPQSIGEYPIEIRFIGKIKLELEL